MAVKLILRYAKDGQPLQDCYVEQRYRYWTDLVRRSHRNNGMHGDFWDLSFSTLNIFYQFFLGHLMGELEDIEVVFIDEKNGIEVPVAEAWKREFFGPIEDLVGRVEELLLTSALPAKQVMKFDR